MRRSILYVMAIAVGALASTTLAAEAAVVETPLPVGTFIQKDGLDWAWAYPLPSTASGFDLSYQSQFGWRLPTAQELLDAPLGPTF